MIQWWVSWHSTTQFIFLDPGCRSVWGLSEILRHSREPWGERRRAPVHCGTQGGGVHSGVNHLGKYPWHPWHSHNCISISVNSEKQMCNVVSFKVSCYPSVHWADHCRAPSGHLGRSYHNSPLRLDNMSDCYNMALTNIFTKPVQSHYMNCFWVKIGEY